jgi:hypothetical protein
MRILFLKRGNKVSLWIFLFISLFLLICFCVTPKRMHLYEVFFLWLIIWMFTLNIFWIVGVNLQWLKVSIISYKYSVHTLRWILFDPLLIIFFFDLTLKVKKRVKKMYILLIPVTILTFFQYLFIYLKVYRIQHWNASFSLIQMIFIVFVCYGFWKWYRKKLAKEGLI